MAKKSKISCAMCSKTIMTREELRVALAPSKIKPFLVSCLRLAPYHKECYGPKVRTTLGGLRSFTFNEAFETFQILLAVVATVAAIALTFTIAILLRTTIHPVAEVFLVVLFLTVVWAVWLRIKSYLQYERKVPK